LAEKFGASCWVQREKGYPYLPRALAYEETGWDRVRPCNCPVGSRRNSGNSSDTQEKGEICGKVGKLHG
jgi:hypothetical protein